MLLKYDVIFNIIHSDVNVYVCIQCVRIYYVLVILASTETPHLPYIVSVYINIDLYCFIPYYILLIRIAYTVYNNTHYNTPRGDAHRDNKDN